MSVFVIGVGCRNRCVDGILLSVHSSTLRGFVAPSGRATTANFLHRSATAAGDICLFKNSEVNSRIESLQSPTSAFTVIRSLRTRAFGKKPPESHDDNTRKSDDDATELTPADVKRVFQFLQENKIGISELFHLKSDWDSHDSQLSPSEKVKALSEANRATYEIVQKAPRGAAFLHAHLQPGPGSFKLPGVFVVAFNYRRALFIFATLSSIVLVFSYLASQRSEFNARMLGPPVSSAEFLNTYLPSGEVKRIDFISNKKQGKANQIVAWMRPDAVIDGRKVDKPAVLVGYEGEVEIDHFIADVREAERNLGIVVETNGIPISFQETPSTARFIFNGLSILFFYGALMAFLKQRQFFRVAKKAANEGTTTGKEASRGGGLGKKK